MILSRTRVVMIIGGSVIILAVLSVSGVLPGIASAVRFVLTPVARLSATLGFHAGRSVAPTPSPEEMQQRIHELESRQSALAVDYVQLRVLQEENQSLRKVAGFLTESGYDHVGARVIARSTDTHTATILIDRGTVDGVENGMAVVAEDGVLVGKIVNITERSSEVMLISDERSDVAASRAGARTLLGLVEGEGRGIARLNLVPQEEALKPDEVVVTAGTEAKIPADLPLALVSDVQGVPTDPFKTATLEPLIDAGSLDLVVVLRPSALRPSSP